MIALKKEKERLSTYRLQSFRSTTDTSVTKERLKKIWIFRYATGYYMKTDNIVREVGKDLGSGCQ
jgi:hypothetical protein